MLIRIKNNEGECGMAQRYVIPPKTDNEKFAIGLDMAQLMWLAGGIAFGFGMFMLSSRIINSLLFDIGLGVISATIVAPFMFIKPKEGSMSLLKYFRLKIKVRARNNILPNKRNRKAVPNDSESRVFSTDGDGYQGKQDVRDIDIRLGGSQ